MFLGRALTILSWDNPVTAYFRKSRKTTLQPWQAIAQRFCSIPDSVTKIGGYAFFNCGSLKYIEIPENVLSIGNYAFRGCYSLAKIEIPPRVKK